MNTIKQLFTKARTIKVFVLISIVAILVCALYAYSVSIMHYSFVLGMDKPIEVVEQKDSNVKDRIAAVSPEYKELLWNLAKCESHFNEFAVGINKGSIDRGVFQINNKFQKEVSDECAFNVECATKWTVNEIKNGGIHQWSCKNKI